jgi:glycosyltransferase involved in cell wall biosynthesis
MEPARIGFGGLKLSTDVVIEQMRRHTDFTVIHQPSLRGRVPPWTLVKRLWQYAGQVDLYYGVSYGQWPRYLFARMRGKGTVCHWAGTDVLRVLHKPLHRWWFRAVINRCIDRHLVVSENLAVELATLGVRTQHVPLISSLVEGDVHPLPDEFAILAYLPAKRGDFYGAPVVYSIATRNPQWEVYIVGRSPTPQGKALPNVHELGAGADMGKVYPRVSVLVRPTVHDGLPRMILEAMSWGRYVVFSRPFPHCLMGKSVEEVERALQGLARRDEPNWAGAAYVRETYTEERIIGSLVRVFLDVLDDKRLI